MLKFMGMWGDIGEDGCEKTPVQTHHKRTRLISYIAGKIPKWEVTNDPNRNVFELIDLPSLKVTAKALENGWLEYSFPFGARRIFRAFAVSFRECNSILRILTQSGVILRTQKHPLRHTGSFTLPLEGPFLLSVLQSLRDS